MVEGTTRIHDGGIADQAAEGDAGGAGDERADEPGAGEEDTGEAGAEEGDR